MSNYVHSMSFIPITVGTVMLNPNTQDSPSIMIRYKEYSTNMPVVFPKLDTILELASKEMDSVSSIFYTHTYTTYTF